MNKADKKALEFLKELAGKELEIAGEYLPEILDPAKDFERLKEVIKLRITELIEQDFEHLLFILYRADVSEIRLRKALEEAPPADAPEIITGFLIERQLSKYETRKRFSNGDEEPSDWSDDL